MPGSNQSDFTAGLQRSEQNTILISQAAVELLPEHEVFGRVALRTDDIEEVAATLNSKGLELSSIYEGKRLDPQGRLIQWKMFTISGDFHGLPYPFVIQWNDTDANRLQQLTTDGVIQEHPSGKITLEAAEFHVEHPEETAAHWQELFSLIYIA